MRVGGLVSDALASHSRETQILGLHSVLWLADLASGGKEK